MDEFKYEIVEHVGVVSSNGRGWNKEVNYVSWNDREAKVDIRDWTEDHQRMSKGISLSKEEAAALRDILNSMKL